MGGWQKAKEKATMETTNSSLDGKKRVCAQVEDQTKEHEEEKPKKVRVNMSAARHDSSPTRKSSREVAAVAASGKASIASPLSIASSPAMGKGGKNVHWDLESALLYLVRSPGEGGPKEYITFDKSTWVTFQVGHDGDASTIACLYRQSKRRDTSDSPELEPTQILLENGNISGTEEEPSVSSMLEVWLADGIGDEDTPPSVYCLVAHVHSTTTTIIHKPPGSKTTTTKTTTTLGAVAMLTLAIADGERILRVEWMHLDPSLPPDVASTLEKRLWLRLSALAWMTACQLLTVDEHTRLEGTSRETVSKPLIPSAE